MSSSSMTTVKTHEGGAVRGRARPNGGAATHQHILAVGHRGVPDPRLYVGTSQSSPGHWGTPGPALDLAGACPNRSSATAPTGPAPGPRRRPATSPSAKTDRVPCASTDDYQSIASDPTAPYRSLEAGPLGPTLSCDRIYGRIRRRDRPVHCLADQADEHASNSVLRAAHRDPLTPSELALLWPSGPCVRWPSTELVKTLRDRVVANERPRPCTATTSRAACNLA
jgi:hypothetical protein